MSHKTALIHCYLHIDPDTLTDDEFAVIWGRLYYWLKWTKTID